MRMRGRGLGTCTFLEPTHSFLRIWRYWNHHWMAQALLWKFPLMVSVVIIESVESICRDDTDTQYTTIKKIPISETANLLVAMYRSSLCIFLTNKTGRSVEKHQESTKPESSKTAKTCFFSSPLLLSTGRLAHVVWISHNASCSIVQWAVHCPIAFSQLPHKALSLSTLSNYDFIWDAILLNCTHAQLNNDLAMK